LRTDKYAALCTDLHLENRNIINLRGFENFISLDTLWLNSNRLQSFEGLEDNFRLKGLHLYGNRIRRLQRHWFAPFKYLSILTLNDNQLEDIDKVIRELKNMRNLTFLNLYSNPIAEEDNYRLRILAACPTVTIFDRHVVTNEEHIEVKKNQREDEEVEAFRPYSDVNDEITRS
jgi:Leucine-rich repeat